MQRRRVGERGHSAPVAKPLPDDYTVIHSFRMISKDEGGLHLPTRSGLRHLPSRAGASSASRRRREESSASTASGSIKTDCPIRHGGPDSQADSAKWKLLLRFRELDLEDLSRRCRVNHAGSVRPPSIDSSQVGAITRGPEKALRDITLCRNDLANPEPQIERIMSIGKQEHPTNLTEAEAQEILDSVLLPSFDIIPSRRTSYDYNEFSFIRLLKSQARVLDFPQDQKRRSSTEPRAPAKRW